MLSEEGGLDFFELYQRYKLAIKCLEEAEAAKRTYQLKYQKFVNNLKNKKREQN